MSSGRFVIQDPMGITTFECGNNRSGGVCQMKNQSAFLKKISKNGLYIILFLCICAVGVAGYIMYQTQEKPEITEPVVQREELSLDNVFGDVKPVEVPRSAPKSEDAPQKDTDKKTTAPAPEATQKAVAPAPVADDGPTEFVSAVSGKVAIPFSGDELIKSETFGDWRTHAGIDIAADEGTQVKAIAKGVVKQVFEDEMMGHTVVIEHADGVVSRYCNLMKGVVAKVGQTVKAGDVIGGIGASALSEVAQPPHLHLEVTKNGAPIDPMSLLEEKK